MSAPLDEKRAIETVIRQGNPALWDRIKPADRNSLVKTFRETLPQITYQQSTSVYSGPIPSPGMLDEFNKVMPNGADRVMRMAEEQSQHRMRLETATVTSQNKQGERGQYFAIASVMALIFAGVAVCYLGCPVVGGTIFGTTVVGIGGVFIYGKRSMRKSLDKKAERV